MAFTTTEEELKAFFAPGMVLGSAQLRGPDCRVWVSVYPPSPQVPTGTVSVPLPARAHTLHGGSQLCSGARHAQRSLPDCLLGRKTGTRSVGALPGRAWQCRGLSPRARAHHLCRAQARWKTSAGCRSQRRHAFFVFSLSRAAPRHTLPLVLAGETPPRLWPRDARKQQGKKPFRFLVPWPASPRQRRRVPPTSRARGGGQHEP